MQVAFYLAGEITQVKESIPWVRCASGNIYPIMQKIWCNIGWSTSPTFTSPIPTLPSGGWKTINVQSQCYLKAVVRDLLEASPSLADATQVTLIKSIINSIVAIFKTIIKFSSSSESYSLISGCFSGHLCWSSRWDACSSLRMSVAAAPCSTFYERQDLSNQMDN